MAEKSMATEGAGLEEGSAHGANASGVGKQDQGEQARHDGQVQDEDEGEAKVPAEKVSGAGDGLCQDRLQHAPLHVPGDQVRPDEHGHERADELHGRKPQVGEDAVSLPKGETAHDVARADERDAEEEQVDLELAPEHLANRHDRDGEEMPHGAFPCWSWRGPGRLIQAGSGRAKRYRFAVDLTRPSSSM
jgi:hypothetical protein